MSTQISDPFNWVGATIDDLFLVEQLVGWGGFGIVYRAMHVKLGKPVAVKCLRLPPLLSTDERETMLVKFRREAQVLHNLSSLTANIVRLMHYGTATSPNGHFTPYMVMEWLDGRTLEDEIKARPTPMGFVQALELLDPVAKAISLAHDERISHRDVKPANIFLVTTKTGPLAKVLDFGIAKVFENEPTSSSGSAVTEGGMRMFTPRYAAPEQFSSEHGATGPWTDVFAMALVALETASGKPAFEDAGRPAMYRRALSVSTAPDLFRRITDIDPKQEQVIRRALHTDVEIRYRNLRDFWQDLRMVGPAVAHSPPPVLGEFTQPQSPAVHASLRIGIVPTPSDPNISGKKPLGLPAAGENRICTVIYIDLASPARSGAKMNAERITGIADRRLRIVEEDVTRWGGLVQRQAGNKAIVVFGIPRAADDDTDRAMFAALQIRADIARLPTTQNSKEPIPGIRMGIATGRVFVQSSDVGALLTVTGDPVDFALRLQQVAKNGEILATRESCRISLGSLDVETLPAISFDDGPDTLVAMRILRAAPERRLFPPTDFLTLETKFVGRDIELSQILNAFETCASEHQRRQMTLVGAPGIGRTRLVAETLAALGSSHRTPLLLSGQGALLMRDTSYGLVAAMLRRRFELDETDSPEETRQKLRKELSWEISDLEVESDVRQPVTGLHEELSPDEVDDALTQFEIILGMRENQSSSGSFSNESAQFVKLRIRTAISRILRRIARRTPIALVCDDLQWVDDASLDFFDDLLRDDSDVAIFFIGSARPEFFERRPQWGEDRELHTRIDLAPLPRRHVEEMVRDRLRKVSNLPVDLVQLVVDRTEGYPRIAEETLYFWVDSGVLEMHPEAPWTVHPERMGALVLPTTIQGIVQARIDRLDPRVSHLLFRAAIIGRTFWQGALAHVCRDEPISAGELESQLDVLRDRLFVRRKRPSSLPGEDEFVFLDAATQEVAYQMPARTVLEPLHLSVAEWLNARVAEQKPALLANHYECGGDFGRAALAYEKAAALAASLGEMADALRHVEKARDLFDTARTLAAEPVTDTGSTVSLVATDDCVRVRMELGDVLRRMGRLDEAEIAYEEARQHIGRQGHDIEFVARRFDARIDYRLGLVQRTRGALDAAILLVRRAIDGAESTNSTEDLPPMYALLVFLYRRLKRPDEAAEAAHRALRICRSVPASERNRTWRLNAVESLLGLAVALIGKNRFTAAERTYRQVCRMITESSHAQQISLAYNGIAGIRMIHGDLQEGRTYLLRSLRLKQRLGDPNQLAIAHSNISECELRLSNVRAAIDHAKKAIHYGEQARAGYDLADMYRNLAQASIAAGDFDSSIDAGTKALAIASNAGRIYLPATVATVAQCCSKVINEAVSGSPIHTKAVKLAQTLLQVLDGFADDPTMTERVKQWRILVEPIATSTNP